MEGFLTHPPAQSKAAGMLYTREAEDAHSLPTPQPLLSPEEYFQRRFNPQGDDALLLSHPPGAGMTSPLLALFTVSW